MTAKTVRASSEYGRARRACLCHFRGKTQACLVRQATAKRGTVILADHRRDGGTRRTRLAQRAQFHEDAGFTDAEYTAAAEQLADGLYATWPRDVPFPMIGARPDLGVGVIGVIIVTEDGTSDVPGSIQKPTRLIDEADVESPFSIEIDDLHVFGSGTAASQIGR